MRQSFYIGVKGIITTPDGVLILKDTKRGKWELPGGRIDAGQAIAEAFARELGEELAGTKDVSLGNLVYAAVGDFEVENKHKLCLLFYKAKAQLPAELTLSDEHDEYAFVTRDSLNSYDLFSTDKAALNIYFNE